MEFHGNGNPRFPIIQMGPVWRKWDTRPSCDHRHTPTSEGHREGQSARKEFLPPKGLCHVWLSPARLIPISGWYFEPFFLVLSVCGSSGSQWQAPRRSSAFFYSLFPETRKTPSRIKTARKANKHTTRIFFLFLLGTLQATSNDGMADWKRDF